MEFLEDNRDNEANEPNEANVEDESSDEDEASVDNEIIEINVEHEEDEAIVQNNQGDGFDYTPAIVWLFANQEYLPNPDEEDVEAKVLTRMEMHSGAFVLRNYCTNKQAIEEHAKYKKEMEENARLHPVEEPKPVEWVADDLYGSVVGRTGPVGPNPLEVDPSLATREPIVLTPEEEYYYGPMEPASPPPIPNLHAPLQILNPSVMPPVPDGQSSNFGESMAAMSLNDIPQADPPGHSFFSTTLSREDEWNGHPMQDPGIMYFYEEDFRLIPGDVIIFTTPRLEESLSDEPPNLRCLVSIYEDSLYFEDHGQFRHNFLDKYPLMHGDIVVRFGNFNRWWHWNRHPTINFYMYWPGLRPPLGSDKKILHPWYWINHGLLQFGGPFGPTLPITPPLAPPNMPIGVLAPDFRLRDGDVLIHHNMASTNIAPPFDHKLECHVWNPILDSVGEEVFVSPHDRVLRHGMNFQYCGSQSYGLCASTAHVELYHRDQEGDWRFLGRWTAEFSDHIIYEPAIQPLGLVPLAGDIIFDRSTTGRQTAGWNEKLHIGGLVSFHKWEYYKDLGREARPFVWFKDAGKYGLGNITMVLRLGAFDNDELDDWRWRHSEHTELFILNTRGSSWRLNTAEKRPESLPFNKPNYSWKPYNPNDLGEVAPNFGPQSGDVIIRLQVDHARKRRMKRNPVYVGSSFNPHYQVKVCMGLFGPHIQIDEGDFLIRAGYERNQINEKWTNATVECYLCELQGEDLVWTCKGRDVYVFGTQFTRGGLQGVESSGFGDYSVGDIESINSNPNRPMFGDRR